MVCICFIRGNPPLVAPPTALVESISPFSLSCTPFRKPSRSRECDVVRSQPSPHPFSPFSHFPTRHALQPQYQYRHVHMSHPSIYLYVSLPPGIDSSIDLSLHLKASSRVYTPSNSLPPLSNGCQTLASKPPCSRSLLLSSHPLHQCNPTCTSEVSNCRIGGQA